MRFQVPQFIEVEDKIFGPLTFKQFIYLGGGAGLTVLAFTLIPKLFAFFLSAPIVVFSLALAFYRVNNKPFIEVVEAAFKYAIGAKLYIWRKTEKKPVAKADAERRKVAPEQIYVPKLSDSKLKDLTWELDIKEQANPGTRETMSN
jgi:hypothetical protein